MKNILVIDDSNGLRSLVAMTMAQCGFSVREAKDGREGIQMVINERPDLIICDVKMPGMDGYRTLEAIRKTPGTAAIPFILMTGSMGPDDFRRGMISGADDYIMKPFTPEQLVAAVKSRFARQVEIQTETFHRMEMHHREAFKAFSQLSQELTAPVSNSMATVIAGSTVPVNNLPVYCLD